MGMSIDVLRHCDRCGAILTRKNNKCGFEICDRCNDCLEKQVKNEPREVLEDGNGNNT